ncbi:hypothetical protein BpHYR1_038446 [Brachionus plicatilis]|uniref:Uncharacterized protein n=1 Tax=Brachionus plicatilis TaxID=10195 RepID=A0A3M7Q5G1_BRAPC|nr:hypothetical protein BpHYR1_038446 [Brachionus plicatilis]
MIFRMIKKMNIFRFKFIFNRFGGLEVQIVKNRCCWDFRPMVYETTTYLGDLLLNLFDQFNKKIIYAFLRCVALHDAHFSLISRNPGKLLGFYI